MQCDTQCGACLAGVTKFTRLRNTIAVEKSNDVSSTEARIRLRTWIVGGFTFSADFDSGNCGGVVEITTADDKMQQPVRIFSLSVLSDCEGTEFEKSNCDWFHFSVSGKFSKGQRLKFFVGSDKYKLRLGSLLQDGMRPVVRSLPACPAWRFVSSECSVECNENGSPVFSFEHTVDRALDGETLFFATFFPYPLTMIDRVSDKFEERMRSLNAYIFREHLCDSLEGRKIELITVTHSEGKSELRQPPIPGIALKGTRPHVFPGRRSVFISARVHPGETPASYVLEGFLKALANGCRGFDASELLRRYVFFIIPVLNPDGVALGHQRTDTRGVNLNRVYGEANPVDHPSIFAGEGACITAHKYQGKVRLYLDLHAHGWRRGSFTFGNSPAEGAPQLSRLYCYALARRCSFFEYPQCTFDSFMKGTGKSTMASKLDGALTFTLETNFCRGHYSAEHFTPPSWIDLGSCCLEALADLDEFESRAKQNAEQENSATSSAACKPTSQGTLKTGIAEDMQDACSVMNGFKALNRPVLDSICPSRACPKFAMVSSPSHDFKPSPELWRHTEIFGEVVQLVDEKCSRTGDKVYKAEMACCNSLWIQDRDLSITENMVGQFFYQSISATPVTEGPEPDSKVVSVLPSGTAIVASERRVVMGSLRVLIVVHNSGDAKCGWASEYHSVAFDARLGGIVQLMRRRFLPGVK